MDVEQALKVATTKPMMGVQMREMNALRTLAAEVRRLRGAVPDGSMRDHLGIDRPIHGVPPFTADGYIGGSMSPVWTLVDGKAYRCYLSMVGELGAKVFVAGTTTCYSTREAAEAARRAKP